MSEEQPGNDPESQRRLQELGTQVAINRAAIDALQARADEANHWEAASDERADTDRHRIDYLEERLDVDQAMIAELQAEGVLGKEHAEQLEEALRSSRQIGAAIGIVMAHRRVSEEVAFAILSRASQNANRKLRVLAGEVVHTGDVSGLPGM